MSICLSNPSIIELSCLLGTTSYGLVTYSASYSRGSFCFLNPADYGIPASVTQESGLGRTSRSFGSFRPSTGKARRDFWISQPIVLQSGTCSGG